MLPEELMYADVRTEQNNELNPWIEASQESLIDGLAWERIIRSIQDIANLYVWGFGVL